MKISYLTTMSLCLFSVTAAATSNQQTATLSYDKLLDLAINTSPELWGPPEQVSPFYLNDYLAQESKNFTKDHIYAGICASVNFTTPMYKLPQRTAYLTMALDHLKSISIPNNRFDKRAEKYVSKVWNDRFKYLKRKTSATTSTQKMQVENIINAMLDTYDAAYDLGIIALNCNASYVSTINSVQNILNCMSQEATTAAENTVYKNTMIRKIPKLISDYAVTLDRYIMQIGILQLIMPTFIEGTAPDISKKHLLALNSVAQQVLMIRQELLGNYGSTSQLAFLYNQSTNYVLKGGLMSSAQRIDKLLPELARALALVKFKDTADSTAALNNVSTQRIRHKP